MAGVQSSVRGSPCGQDDDLCAGRGDTHLHPGVAILSELSGQELVQLGLEDPVGDELTNRRGHQRSQTRVNLTFTPAFTPRLQTRVNLTLLECVGKVCLLANLAKHISTFARC